MPNASISSLAFFPNLYKHFQKILHMNCPWYTSFLPCKSYRVCTNPTDAAGHGLGPNPHQRRHMMDRVRNQCGWALAKWLNSVVPFVPSKQEIFAMIWRNLWSAIDVSRSRLHCKTTGYMNRYRVYCQTFRPEQALNDSDKHQFIYSVLSQNI